MRVRARGWHRPIGSVRDDASEASTMGREGHCGEVGHVPGLNAGSQGAWVEAGERKSRADGPDSDWSEDAFACFERAVADFDVVLHEIGSQPFCWL